MAELEAGDDPLLQRRRELLDAGIMRPRRCPEAIEAGDIQLGVGFHDTGPLAEPGFLLHQETGDPFNVSDHPECSPAWTPWIMNFGDPASPAKGGEYFGWAVGS